MTLLLPRRRTLRGLAPFSALVLAAVLAAIPLLLLIPAPVAAQKGGKPADPPPPGTILLDVTIDAGTPDWYQEQWGMKSDGTGKKAAFWHTFQANSSRAVPSSLVYGTDPILDRLWLTVGDVPYTRADGTVRLVRELLASRLDVNGKLWTVQLTALYPHITLPVNQYSISWSNDGKDTFISFKGRSFGQDTAETPTGERDLTDDQTHVFRLNISGADIEQAFELGIDPKFGVVDFADGWIESVLDVDSIYEGAIETHHWSPDGKKVVYYMIDGLWVATLTSGGAVKHGSNATFHLWQDVEHAAVSPQWSPDGQRIAFGRAGRIRTIKPDGTGSALVLDMTRTDSYGAPHWSPDSGHLVVQHVRSKAWGSEHYISRVPAAGGTVTILTTGMDTSVNKVPTAWVSNVPAFAP